MIEIENGMNESPVTPRRIDSVPSADMVSDDVL